MGIWALSVIDYLISILLLNFVVTTVSFPFVAFSSSSRYAIKASANRPSYNLFASKSNNLYQSRPLTLETNDNTVKLKSSISRFQYKKSNEIMSVVDLYSLVHIGDYKYYEEIQSLAENYDIILYELITSNDNVKYHNNQRQLNIEIYAEKANQLARLYNLSTQLDMDLMQSNWYIADLSKEVVDNLEQQRLPITTAKFWASQLGGRASSEKFLKNFFFPDNSFITLLRLLCWALPTPELAVLTIDWSRMNPRPGGIPSVLGPILENIAVGDFAEAKKLAFTQSLISGLPDSGYWGGASRSDVEVRVSARNEECIRVLSSFLFSPEPPTTSTTSYSTSPASSVSTTASATISQDQSNKINMMAAADGPSKKSVTRIAVLYGAYHIDDLRDRFRDLGLVPVPVDPKTASFPSSTSPPELDFQLPSSLVVWSMTRPKLPFFSPPLPPPAHTTKTKDTTVTESSTSISSDSSPQTNGNNKKLPFIMWPDIEPTLRVALTTILPLYLFLGAVDWWLMLYCLGSWIGAVSVESGNPGIESWSTAALSSFFVISYFQRHFVALQALSQVAVQWDRSLFEDATVGR